MTVHGDGIAVTGTKGQTHQPSSRGPDRGDSSPHPWTFLSLQSAGHASSASQKDRDELNRVKIMYKREQPIPCDQRCYDSYRRYGSRIVAFS
ncbi:hypothetical protein PoB_001627600 [Plakobranchus ocellatus]|uniref:Uncharacterized protein n=1 Tax=Plakobranchus ocellatus TaxID=259542 RepID=A0AAV3Z596_9GAST|nr:hypothetical protein PoB_001627600 [Plakobranchus ocellatus]